MECTALLSDANLLALWKALTFGIAALLWATNRLEGICCWSSRWLAAEVSIPNFVWLHERLIASVAVWGRSQSTSCIGAVKLGRKPGHQPHVGLQGALLALLNALPAMGAHAAILPFVLQTLQRLTAPGKWSSHYFVDPCMEVSYLFAVESIDTCLFTGTQHLLCLICLTCALLGRKFWNV